jgi:hypothetical protein
MSMQAETSWKALLSPTCCNFHKLTTIAIIASKAAIFHRTFITYKISSPDPYLLDYPPYLFLRECFCYNSLFLLVSMYNS